MTVLEWNHGLGYTEQRQVKRQVLRDHIYYIDHSGWYIVIHTSTVYVELDFFCPPGQQHYSMQCIYLASVSLKKKKTPRQGR